MSRILEIPARPEPVSLDPARAAVIVVDLQNGYVSPGGYRDLIDRDIGPAPRVVENTNRILGRARDAGMTIVFLQNGWDPELREGGGENSPNWHKSNPLKLMRAKPQLHGKILTRGGWDYDLVDEIRPEPDDLIVPKHGTAALPAPTSMLCCASVTSVGWYSPALPRTSASNPLCGTRIFESTSVS